MRYIIAVLFSFFGLFLGYSGSYASQIYTAGSEECQSPDASTESSLYVTNTDNLNTTFIGNIGFNGVTGLAFLGDGRLVGSAQADANGNKISILIEIDPATGAGSLIGVIGNNHVSGCGRVPDLAYDRETGILYGIGAACQSGSTEELLRIDPDTGVATIIGDTQVQGGGNGLAFDNDHTLFLASGSVPFDRLFTIDPLSATATFIANIDVDGNIFTINALDNDPASRTMYGSLLIFNGSSDASLVKLDTLSAEVETISGLPDCTDALAVSPGQVVRNIPALSVGGLIGVAAGLALIGLFFAIRRKSAIV